MSIPEGALCLRNKLCSYDPLIDNEEVLIEICSFCGRKQRYNKVNGGLDNAKFVNNHFRDFLVPYGSQRDLYIQIYGTDSLKAHEQALKDKAKRLNKPSIDDMLAYGRDVHKTMKRIESKAKLDKV